MSRLPSLLAFVMAFAAAPAPDVRADPFDFAGDRFLAGPAPDIAAPVAGDLFASGERVDVGAEVGGAAHLAARRISVRAPVGGALYAAGMDLRVTAPITGAATLAGYDVDVAAPVGGALRAFARHIVVSGDVGGSLLAAGTRVEITGTVAGDADVTAETLTFGPGARIDGTLTVRGVSADAVPQGVAGTVRTAALPEGVERFGENIALQLPGLGEILLAAILAFLTAVLVVAALALLAASLFPRQIEDWAELALIDPGATLWAGVVTLSLILGGAAVLALTGIGALALPFIAFAGFVLGAAGYVLGCYTLGIRMVADGAAPYNVGPRAAAALVGAVVVSLLSLIPFVGWLVTLAVALFGLGAFLPARARIGAAAT